MNPRKTLLTLMGFLTLGAGGLAWVVHRFGLKDRSRRCGAIVVLGAKVLPGGVPSASLVARVTWAVRLHRAGLAPCLVFSGGAAVAGCTEALAMKRLALAQGMDEADCLLEDQSRTTDENARFTVKLLRERGIGDCLVVSDGFHLFRARQTFRHEGVEPALSPAMLEGRRLSLGDTLYWTFREAFILWLRPCLLFQRKP